jgi:predicted NAD/FAD-dependent oxidoreductase
MHRPKNIAIVGAGLAAISCARTLVQAGHRVTLFEKSKGVGGRMSTRRSPFGTFDMAPSTSPCATRALPRLWKPPPACAAPGA